MAVSLRSFFFRKRLLASENGFYILANMFCHVGPDSRNKFEFNCFSFSLNEKI